MSFGKISTGLWEKKTWNSTRPKFVKKTSMLNSVESLGYIKCSSSRSPRPVKRPSNSIRYNCQKICSWSWRPKTILEIRKKDTLTILAKSCIWDGWLGPKFASAGKYNTAFKTQAEIFFCQQVKMESFWSLGQLIVSA